MIFMDKKTVVKRGWLGLKPITFEDILLNRISTKDPAPISFKDLFGDLSENEFHGNLWLSGLNLTSLEGCPDIIYNGLISLIGNPNLHSLDFFPKEMISTSKQNPLSEIHVSPEQFSSLNSLPRNVFKTVQSVHCDKVSLSEEELVLFLSEFRKVKKNFPEIITGSRGMVEPDYLKLESLFKIYEKLNFNEVKFRRALSLL